jgi:tRNA(adenine34) deaminase
VWSEVSTTDRHWIGLALDEARLAAADGEVPVGALVVRDNVVVGRGANATEREQDPTAHAEIVAIRRAAAHLGTRRLHETSLYVSLEPCAMCAGAIVLARIPLLVFGAYDPKSGACGSLRNLVCDPRLNHQCAVRGGVMEPECSRLLKEFFEEIRSSTD